MPSIQSKAINVLLRILRTKRTVNRMRERVAAGERTYTEPSRRLRSKHQISKREVNRHLVWTIAPKANAKHVIYLHGGASVTLMGDSSGGGISLALAQRLREDGHEQPGHIVLLSPWLDATLSNPEISEFDKIDPFLGTDGLKYGGAAYARDVDPKSYLVSPVYGSLRGLAPISLFIGTRDILFPDCRKLREQARTEGVEINYREYEGMVHDWMLVAMPEGKQAVREIVEAIR